MQKQNQKHYVLDTNILLHNPNCLEKFQENHIYIPHVVIEELDGLKKAPGETGYSAREASRKINEYRKKGKLVDGVETEGGGKLHLFIPDAGSTDELPDGWNPNKSDNRILAAVKRLSEKASPVILVSNDTNMQLKADAMGVEVQEYKNDKISENVSLYTGRSVRYLSDADFSVFSNEKKITPDRLMNYEGAPERLTINEFITLKPASGGGSILAKYDGVYVRTLNYESYRPCDLRTRNSGQIFLKEALMSPCAEHPLTICVGPAGTAKTLFAVGCGLDQVMEKQTYKRVLLCRPNVMMDEEIGFLPGTEFEKISPLFRGVYDNLEILFGNKDDSRKQMQDKVDEVFDRGYIDAQSLAYLRGRSITDTYVIIDEAQNCTPNQIFSIITRAGERSKFVIIGDPNQIDNPRLDKRNNGLVFALEHMKGSKLCEVMTFDESECTRSELAKEASDRLRTT